MNSSKRSHDECSACNHVHEDAEVVPCTRQYSGCGLCFTFMDASGATATHHDDDCPSHSARLGP